MRGGWLALAALALALPGPASGERAPAFTGDVRRHPEFRSVRVSAREVLVYLPPGYEREPAVRYPVLYFQDGQNVFDASTSTIGVEWGVDEVAERCIRSGALPPFIAVAVPSTGARIAEYAPVPDRKYGGGGAAVYRRFVVEELKPFVDKTYRTLPDRAHTGVVGSSLGGVVSLYLGLERPDVFGLVGCVSPSVWFGGRDLVRRVRAGRGTGLRIWLDMGTREGTTPREWRSSVEGARALRGALRKRGYREGVDLHYQEFPGAEHSEHAWAARGESVLAFLLGASAPR